MTDADVDGSHIRTLLLTFFFRQMPELIKTRGTSTCAQPPLYQIMWGHAERLIEEHDLILDDLGATEARANGQRERVCTLRELHENREMQRLFERLADQQVHIEDYGLVQEESVTGEKLPSRYAWMVEADGKDSVIDVPNIPAILTALHEVGRKGMELKRFKGLGEMNPEQLWDTTMDPAQRTLLRVTWDTASDADELFSTLMGEDVESRRTYIEDHALEVKNLDI
jgi:DNA gyrase/topoisomerase IV subunit B